MSWNLGTSASPSSQTTRCFCAFVRLPSTPPTGTSCEGRLTSPGCNSGYASRRNRVLGCDVAGHVEAVGNNVMMLQPGEEVFGSPFMHGLGAFAEWVCISEDLLAPKPANLSFEQAAAVPLAASTALQGLRDYGRIEPGQKVLIIGASGGVGTFAVQIARSFDAEVSGVCSTRNVEMSDRSGRTTSSATPRRTSPEAGTSTISSSSWRGAVHGQSAGARLPPRGGSC
jgi:D-arabinose 1-dehydrogenase-like Zn-dependent alcohol dehydrogenase